MEWDGLNSNAPSKIHKLPLMPSRGDPAWLCVRGSAYGWESLSDPNRRLVCEIMLVVTLGRLPAVQPQATNFTFLSLIFTTYKMGT